MSHQDPEEALPSWSSLVVHRLSILILYFSFFACLVSLLLTSPIFGEPNKILSPELILFIKKNHLSILLIPLISLLVCHLSLRYLTGQIMACPERYLDERQKMIRDSAHRRAYKIVQVACLFIPLCFFVYSLLWSALITMPSSLDRTTTSSWSRGVILIHSSQLNIPLKETQLGNLSLSLVDTHTENLQLTNQPLFSPPHQLFFGFDGPVDIAVYYGTFLFCLFLMITALPMSIVSWKERFL